MSKIISSQEKYQMCYESIARVFPDIKNKYPWFPDRPELYISALGGTNSDLVTFCWWIELHMPHFLRFMRFYIEFNKLGDEKDLKYFHETFTIIVTSVWQVDCIIGKLQEEKLNPSVVIGIRNRMHRILNESIKLVVQGDSLWLGEHADWWVPEAYKKERLAQQMRKKK